MFELEQPQDEEGYKAINKENRNKPSRTIPHWQDANNAEVMSSILLRATDGNILVTFFINFVYQFTDMEINKQGLCRRYGRLALPITIPFAFRQLF